MIDEIAQASLLYDFYGRLLTEKKRCVMELYHEENLSLSEIASQFGISRAAVHDSLKSAERSLADYEEKLGLVERWVKTNKAVAEIDNRLDDLAARHAGDKKLVKDIEEIREIIDNLEEV